MSLSSCKRLLKEDYDKTCQDLAVYLLGKILVRKLEDGTLLKGLIVETECYLGGEDKASHSYKGKRTKRNEPMYMPPSTAYVYTLYFGYNCFNVSSKEPGAVVLIRALQPLTGLSIMENFRSKKSKTSNLKIKPDDICNGPSKLCIAMNISKDNANKLDLSDPFNNKLWIEEGADINKYANIVNTSRIGIGPSAEDWIGKPLRYYILYNKSVSKKDRKAEKLIEI